MLHAERTYQIAFLDKSCLLHNAADLFGLWSGGWRGGGGGGGDAHPSTLPLPTELRARI